MFLQACQMTKGVKGVTEHNYNDISGIVIVLGCLGQQ